MKNTGTGGPKIGTIRTQTVISEKVNVPARPISSPSRALANRSARCRGDEGAGPDFEGRSSGERSCCCSESSPSIV